MRLRMHTAWRKIELGVLIEKTWCRVEGYIMVLLRSERTQVRKILQSILTTEN